jgi:hypothetical protein
MTQLMVAFRNFAKASKTGKRGKKVELTGRSALRGEKVCIEGL